MITLPYVLHAMVKELTWMDLYVGSAEEMAKLPMTVHQKIRLTRRSTSLHAKTNADQHPAAIIALHNPLLLVFRIDSNNITEITIHKEHFFTTSGTNRISLVYFNLTYLQ
jgi:hypothetical protein